MKELMKKIEKYFNIDIYFRIQYYESALVHLFDEYFEKIQIIYLNNL